MTYKSTVGKEAQLHFPLEMYSNFLRVGQLLLCLQVAYARPSSSVSQTQLTPGLFKTFVPDLGNAQSACPGEQLPFYLGYYLTKEKAIS